MENIKETSFSTNILIKEEDGVFVAHCLELDIVAVGETLDQARKDIVDLVSAQIDYAFANDNIQNLFYPAPPEIWDQFFSCKEQTENNYKINLQYEKNGSKRRNIPAWLTTKICDVSGLCYV